MPSRQSRRKEKNGYSTHHHSNSTKNGVIKHNVPDKKRCDDEVSSSTRSHSDYPHYSHYDPDTDPITTDPAILTEAIHDIFSAGNMRTVTTLQRKSKKKSHSKRRHRRDKRSAKSKITCCGFTLCHYSGRNCCTSMSFIVSFVLLLVEFILIASSITDNRPLFMSYRLNTDESMSMEEDIDDIDPMKLYRWTHLDVYSFRDDPRFLPMVTSDKNGNHNNGNGDHEGLTEEEIVYRQMVADGFDGEDDEYEVVDIHSDSYFHQFHDAQSTTTTTTHCSDDVYHPPPLMKGYRFMDEDEGYFLTIYQWILREHTLLYTLFKNLIGFLVLVLSIVLPSMARNLYIVVFIACSVSNTCLAMMDPNFYVAFTKTGVSWYKKAIYQFYVRHSVRILLGFAFMEHLIASVFWLKNLSVIMRWQREAERSALKAESKKKSDRKGDGTNTDSGNADKGGKEKDGKDGDGNHNGNGNGDRNGKKKKKSKKQKEKKKKKEKEKRMKRDRVKVPSWMYTVALLLGILNFMVLIPLGVDWNQYGVVWFSSSAISFTVGLLILLLSHCGVLLDEKERERSKRKQRKKTVPHKFNKVVDPNNPKLSVNGENSNDGTGKNKSEGGVARIQLPDRSDSNGHNVKKAMFILWKRAENGEPAKMKTLSIDEIPDTEWKEEEGGGREDKVVNEEDNNNNNIIHSANVKGNEEEKENESFPHKKRMTLMDGTVRKCQCRKCLSRREKRREQRKKMKLLKQMQRCQEEMHQVDD